MMDRVIVRFRRLRGAERKLPSEGLMKGAAFLQPYLFRPPLRRGGISTSRAS